MDSFVLTVDRKYWGVPHHVQFTSLFTGAKRHLDEENFNLSATYKAKTICTKKKGIECPNSTANENRNKTEGNAPPKLKDCAI